jgi:5-guanidino-2-oxopentanoate decarboxylase
MTVGEALSGLLAAYGIDTVFGIPGVHNVELFRGFARSGMRLVRPRHEQGAGFMADGYARASGRPAACFVITGPGLTNLLTPLGQAYSDSVPILAIASTLDAADIGQGLGRLHEAKDQRAIAAAVLDFAVTAPVGREVPELVARAFGEFAAKRPRPAYIEIPKDVLGMEAGGNWPPRPLPARPQPASESIAAAVRLLSAARRPIVIAGGGAVDAAGEVRALVERLGSPVITTIAGKGVVSGTHPLSLGAVLPNEAARALVASADVALAIGTELAETDQWVSGPLPIAGSLIRIDVDPAKLCDVNVAAVPILSDATAALKAIRAGLGERAASAEAARAQVAATLKAIRAQEGELRTAHRRVLEAVRRALPRDAIVVSDMTQIAYSANEIFPVEEPRTWLHPAGFGTLGYALPAAIGAKLARPGRAAAVLVGDYGFQYTLNELATAVELSLPLVVLLWNNAALAEIRDDMVRREIEPVTTDAPTPDFEQLARAFGCAFARPAQLDDVETAIHGALVRKVPTLVELEERRFR